MQASRTPPPPPAPSPRCRAARAAGLAASLLALSAPLHADPVLTTHFSQATYEVDVRAGSDLLAWLGYSGVGITSYSTLQALSGDQVILQAFPGQSVTRTQQLKLHFQSHPGQVFDTVSMSHLLSWFNDRGGYGALMSWTLQPEDGPAQSGTTPWLENHIWGNGGSLSDSWQFSPTLIVDDDAFDLDITLHYHSAGAPGACSTGSGACQQISANYVKVFVATVPGSDDDPAPVPAPSTLALLLGAGLAQALRRRAAATPQTASASASKGACPATEDQRA